MFFGILKANCLSFISETFQIFKGLNLTQTIIASIPKKITERSVMTY